VADSINIVAEPGRRRRSRPCAPGADRRYPARGIPARQRYDPPVGIVFQLFSGESEIKPTDLSVDEQIAVSFLPLQGNPPGHGTVTLFLRRVHGSQVGDSTTWASASKTSVLSAAA
jgi:hypothetical protein